MQAAFPHLLLPLHQKFSGLYRLFALRPCHSWQGLFVVGWGLWVVGWGLWEDCIKKYTEGLNIRSTRLILYQSVFRGQVITH